MEPVADDTLEARRPWGTTALAALVLAGAVLVGAGVLAGGAWNTDQASFPYVWRDVAIVQILCAVPLAWGLAVLLTRCTTDGSLLGLAVLLLGLAAAPLLSAVRESITPALLGWPPLAVVLRATAALGLATSVTLALAVLFGTPRTRAAGSGSVLALLSFGAVVLLLPPFVHVSARCQHDTAQLGEYLRDSRFGEARTLVRGLLALDPGREWNGRPLSLVAADVDRVVGELRSRVAAPLPAGASDDERLARVRHLAMLGRTEAATAVLESMRGPEADHLLGTLYENDGEWEKGLAAHQRAGAAWRLRPASSEQAMGLLRATAGVAYCQRKMGRYAEAEATYEQVLALSPTADSYFLLAQFYEDAQQAEKARTHARRAIELAPDRYQQEGEKLIRKLTVYHFGCLGVFAAEHDRSDATLSP